MCLIISFPILCFHYIFVLFFIFKYGDNSYVLKQVNESSTNLLWQIPEDSNKKYYENQEEEKEEGFQVTKLEWFEKKIAKTQRNFFFCNCI